jgi:hypothetical protein
MHHNFFLILAAILCLPIVPAFIIYKFLPESETQVEGPYNKLNLKLKGAFAGYFLLVLIGVGLQWAVANNRQTRQIEALTRTMAEQDSLMSSMKTTMAASANPVIDWHVKGLVQPGEKEGTRFFFDDGTTTKNPDGSFELIKRTLAAPGKANPPKWICVYNPLAGYRVVSLNRDLNHPDIAAFDVAFNDSAHEILIRKPIDINSTAKDSMVAVAGFLSSNPTLKTQVEAINPQFFIKAEAIRAIQATEKLNHLPKATVPVSSRLQVQ